MFFVRTAAEQDLPNVRSILIDTLHDTYDDIYGREQVLAVIQKTCSIDRLNNQRDTPNSEFLVGDNGEVIGGMAYASQTDKTINLHQIYVHPKYHGGKTGLHLLIEIENSFIDAEKMVVEVEALNARAVGFFKSFGFKEVDQMEVAHESDKYISHLILEKSVIYAED